MPNITEYQHSSEVIQAMVAEAGIDIEIQLIETATLLNQWTARDFEALMIQWSGRDAASIRRCAPQPMIARRASTSRIGPTSISGSP